ncbi:MAG: hypothetical protein KDC34_09460 [Saprospiraceae bacterium]|nr:hypothetical protein [Saprospiraceae bacterium]
MKKLIFLILLLFVNARIIAQPSYDTRIAFVLRDENNEKINLERFMEEYKLADVMARVIPTEELKDYLSYNEKYGYFLLDIETIGPRFSFALYHDNSWMVVYVPFNNLDCYAVDFDFRQGTFLFDFDIEDKEKIFMNSNLPYYVIDRIRWKKQRKRWLKSEYATDDTYNELK